MQGVFTIPDAWSGGSIELLILIHDSSKNIRVKISNTLWQFPFIDGPYTSNQIEPELQVKKSTNDTEARFGIAELNDGKKFAFGTSVIEDEDGVWLYAGIPMGSLAQFFPVGGYPFESSNHQNWQPQVHEWFVSLAKHLHESLPYERGVIGWLTSSEVDEIVDQIIPDERHSTYILWCKNGLEIFEVNTNNSPMKIN